MVEYSQVNGYYLLTPYTFDMCAKLLYGEAYYNDIQCDWPKEVYFKHLEHWNGFIEWKPEQKFGKYNFIKSFEKMIDDMLNKKFDWDKSPIPVDNDGHILNGRHRAVASLITGNEATIAKDNYQNGSHGQKNSNYEMFNRMKLTTGKALPTKYMDAMALEYLKFKPGFAITFFRPVPSEAEKYIKDNYQIIYKKRIKLKNQAPYFLMREIYFGEAWVTPRFSGAQEKADLSYTYPREEWETTIYLVDKKLSIEDKQHLRAFYPPETEKHNVHGCDTVEESRRIAKLLLNDNGVHFLNHAKKIDTTNYNRFILESIPYRINEAITASGVLAAYGLRDCADLDILGIDKDLSENIHSHKSQEVYYGIHRDELLWDPSNYFFWNNQRHVSLKLLRKMKSIRGEEKDKRDVALIDSIYNTKEQ